MSKNLKLYLGISYIVILVSFLFLLFTYIEISKLDEFSYYKELQIGIETIIGKNLYLNLFYYFIFCLIWVTLLGFGLPLLLISGILFGKWAGTLISIFSISVGALILYMIANFFFSDIVNNLLRKKFSKFIEKFKQNEFYYFFAFRLVGGFGVPFGLQNVLPVLFGIKKTNYFFASILGFVPIFFIWNSIGSGLNEYIKNEENFNFLLLLTQEEIYFPLGLFIILIVTSSIVKKKLF